jgi:hypothetical protein
VHNGCAEAFEKPSSTSAKNVFRMKDKKGLRIEEITLSILFRLQKYRKMMKSANGSEKNWQKKAWSEFLFVILRLKYL